MFRVRGKTYFSVEEFTNEKPFIHPKDLPMAVYYLTEGLSRRGGPGGSHDKFVIESMIEPEGGWKVTVKEVTKEVLISDGISRPILLSRLFGNEQELAKLMPEDVNY